MSLSEKTTYNDNQEKVRRKIVLVGPGVSGKTALIVVFTNDEHPGVPEVPYVPTVNASYIAHIKVDNNEMEFLLFDTGGSDSFDRFRQNFYPNTDVVLLCFDISDPILFSSITETFLPEVNHFCPNVPIILVGNKKDLRNQQATLMEIDRCKRIDFGKRKQKAIIDEFTKLDLKSNMVSTTEGKALADEIKAYAYLECSARTGEGVREVFEMAARASLQKHPTTGATY